jgi:hypothetical protein
MSKKLIEGLLGGYIGYKQGQDRRKRQDRQDALYDAIIGNMPKKKGNTDVGPGNPVVSQGGSDTNYGKSSSAEVSPVANSDVEVRPYSPDPLPDGETLDYAHGGMVKPMPQQYDRFSWQRQNFKKGKLSPEEEMAAHMLVIEASMKKGRGK